MTTFPSVLDAVVHPDETAAGLAFFAPQAGSVEALSALDPGGLGQDARIDALVAVERHVAMLQARSQEFLAAIAAADPSEDGFAREQVACALRLPPASVRTRMESARELVGRLPETLALLRQGVISQRHALDLADATSTLSVASARAVEHRVLERAPEQTVAQFRSAIRRAVLRVSTHAETEARHRYALTQRRVVITPVADGMAELWALLPAGGAAAVKTALDAAAHETIHGKGGDSRTADQRRADALVELACVASAAPAAVTAHGQRPAVQVTVAASTLMGLDDQPAELAGYGPITAGMARRIAADTSGTWRRLLTTDDGQIIGYASTAYRPTARMAAAVIARDQHCTFPGCRRPARYCDQDHVRPFRPGDMTSTENLTALCRRHHRLKHKAGWRTERHADTGVMVWVDPRGRTYSSRPPQVPTTPPDRSAASIPASPKRNSPKKGTPKPRAPKPASPKWDGPSRDRPNRDGPNRDGPNRDPIGAKPGRGNPDSPRLDTTEPP